MPLRLILGCLRAVIIESSEAEIVCDAELRYDDKTRATGHAVWKRWRARYIAVHPDARNS